MQRSLAFSQGLAVKLLYHLEQQRKNCTIV